MTEPTSITQNDPELTDEDIREEVQALADELGRRPTNIDYRQADTDISLTEIEERLGWVNVLTDLGYSSNPYYTITDIKEELRRVAAEIDGEFTKEAFVNADTNITASTIENRLGWETALKYVQE